MILLGAETLAVGFELSAFSYQLSAISDQLSATPQTSRYSDFPSANH
jgi:hypothetical protein